MKLPTLPLIRERAKNAWLRFPFSMTLAVMATITAIILIDDSSDIGIKLLMISSLGFFLMIAISVFVENHKLVKYWQYVPHLVGLIFLISYFFLLGDPDDFRRIDILQYTLLYLVTTASIMVAPFIKKKHINGFWQYNKKVFLRLFFTFVSSLTMYIGIALSIASFNYLLGADIEEEWYPRMFAIVVGLVASHTFLSGIPEKFNALEKVKDYPKVIKIFSQYVLTPLIMLYGLILYLYGGKIIVTLDWPKGNVSYLVLVFSVIGIITMLFLYPARQKISWVRTFSKYYYVLLIPLILLLFGAAWIRIADYGLTDARCYVVILGLWLLGISIYFVITKKYNIKVIFYSLILTTLFSSFGPLSVFSISSFDQVSRLESILEDNDILVDNKIKKSEERDLEKGDVIGISSILDYLIEVDRLDKIKDWFDKKDFKTVEKKDDYDQSHYIMKLMGVEYIDRWGYEDVDRVRPTSYHFVSEERDEINIEGYKLLKDFEMDKYSQKVSFNVDDFIMYVSLSENNKRFLIKKGIEDEKVMNMEIFMKEIIDLNSGGRDYYKTDVPDKLMNVDYIYVNEEGDRINLKFFIEDVSISGNGDNLTLERIKGFLLVK